MTRQATPQWTLHAPSELHSLHDDWARLADRLGRPLPLDFQMVESLLAAFEPAGVRIVRLGHGADVAALAVLEQQSALTWRTAKLDNAPLGLWLMDPATTLEPALKALIRSLPGAPLLLSFSGVDPLLVPRPPDSGTIRTLDYFETPAITITQPFDTWFSGCSKNLRHNLRRQARRLAEDGTRVEIRCLVQESDVAGAVRQYAELEATGWKSEAGTAVLPGSRQESFYRRLLQCFASLGQAQIWQIFYGDSLVASDLCLSRDGTTVILKTAYNEARVDNNSSPAQLMRRQMLETLFAAPDARRIEFFGPVKPWHRSWSSEQRTLYHLNHYRWSGIAGLHGRVIERRRANPPTG